MAGKRRAKVTRQQVWVKDPNKKDGPDNPRSTVFIDLRNDEGNGGVRQPSIQETLDLFKRIADGVLQREATKPADEKYLDCAKDCARHVLDIVPHAKALAKSDETRHALMVGIDLAMATMAIGGAIANRDLDELRGYRQRRNRGRDSQSKNSEFLNASLRKRISEAWPSHPERAPLDDLAKGIQARTGTSKNGKPVFSMTRIRNEIRKMKQEGLIS